MTEEEQWAFWQAMNSHVMETLVENDQRLKLIDQKIDALLRRTHSLERGVGEIRSSLLGHDDALTIDLGPTSLLTPTLLTWIHRLVTERMKMPEDLRGQFRSVQVWVGRAGISLKEAKYVAPPPEAIPSLLDKVLEQWRDDYPSLVTAHREATLPALAKFHHGLLSIHPFLDGNGRVARAVTDQAAHELLGIRIGSELGEDREAYYQALEDADKGNFDPLITLFRIASARE